MTTLSTRLDLALVAIAALACPGAAAAAGLMSLHAAPDFGASYADPERQPQRRLGAGCLLARTEIEKDSEGTSVLEERACLGALTVRLGEDATVQLAAGAITGGTMRSPESNLRDWEGTVRPAPAASLSLSWYLVSPSPTSPLFLGGSASAGWFKSKVVMRKVGGPSLGGPIELDLQAFDLSFAATAGLSLGAFSRALRGFAPYVLGRVAIGQASGRTGPFSQVGAGLVCSLPAGLDVQVESMFVGMTTVSVSAGWVF